MVRKQVLLRKDQTDFLKALPGLESEHIRQALDEYIAKKRKEMQGVSVSPSRTING